MKSRGEAASTRQRALGLLEVARAHGWQTEEYFVPAYPRWNYTPRRIIRFLGYWKAFRKTDRQTVVLLQRTLRCPEFLWLLRSMRPRLRYVISDFDDAVWIHSPRYFQALVELSDEVWCGSRVIFDHVKSMGKDPIFVPTLIHTSLFSGERFPESIPVVGWVGDGYSHRENLQFFADILRDILAALLPFRLRLIGIGSDKENITKTFAFMGEKVDYIDWLKPSDVPGAIARFSVGVMPLRADAFNAGKSGLKLIEYLVASVPVIASDVGENAFIVRPPVHGLLARNAVEWKAHLKTLLEQPETGTEMGKHGRTFVLREYDRSAVYGSHLLRLEQLLS